MRDLLPLSDFVATVRAIVGQVPEPMQRTRESVAGFALVEQVWHLADLEQEGFAVRIDRILRESHPSLPDFPGGRLARERRYIDQPLLPALQRFAEMRAANVARLSAATDQEWSRSGEQEGIGEVTLVRVAEMMMEHDASHAAELRDLLVHLGI